MPSTGPDCSPAVPLSYPQMFVQEMLQTMGPRAPVLQLDTCVRIGGPIDVARFERAAAALVARHPILCSRLELSDDRLVQRQESLTPSFEVVAVDGGIDQVDAALSARADRPIDLFQESPLRIVLALTHPGEAFLMVLAHHMVLDATGMKILIDDYLELFLEDAAGAEEVTQADPDRSYFSFVQQEQRMMQDGEFARRARYWLGYLADADPTLHLADRRPDPAVTSFSPIPFRLTGESFQIFTDRARRLGVSQFALAATAIFETLRQATAQDDLLLQVVTDTRRRPFDRTIGQFAERFIVRQRERPSGMGDKAVRTVHRDVLLGMKNQVSLPRFVANEVDWFRKRTSDELSMTEAYVNYLSTVADTARFSAREDYEFSPFYLTARARPSDIPYYGVLLHWEILPAKDSLSGCLQYESAILAPRVAETIAASWIEALSQDGETGCQ